MIEHRQSPIEPCVALHLGEDGVTMDVTAKLAEGALLMTPEEAGEWFKRQWEDARQTLHASTVMRLIGGNGRQMVRSGDVAWAVTETPAESQSVPVPTTPVEVIPALAETVTSSQEASAPASQPEAPATVASPEPAGGEEPADPQVTILTLLIEAGKKGMTTSQLKDQTGLNDYQTRKALRDLKEMRKVNEKVKGRTATYTSR